MNVQNLFPSEHRTPPLPLVSLFGRPEFHKDVSDYFVQILRPPLVSLSAVEPVEQALAKYFGPEKHGVTFGPPPGIIKADWFNKHRGRRPAVGIAFVLRSHLEGDPNVWTRMLHMLKAVREATQQRGAGMVVAVLHDITNSTELPAERVTGLCHNLSLDPRQLVPVSLSLAGAPLDVSSRTQRDASLKALGQLVHEQCAGYYLKQAQHVSLKHLQREANDPEKRCTPETNARTSFKLAVFAEFRQDWREAVEQYRAAYSHLSGVELGQPLLIARWFELCKVSELILLKLLMLMLHQGRVEEVVLLAQSHLATYVTPPEPLPPAAHVSHLGFAVRQYLVVSEVLCSKLEAATAAGQPVPSQAKQLSRAHLMMSAAQSAVARRKAFDELRLQRIAQGGHPPALDVSAVRRVLYVGQLRLQTAQGFSELSDADYLIYLEAEEAGRVGGPVTGMPLAGPGGNKANLGAAAACLEVLGAALVVLKDTQNERMRSRLGLLMAGEHSVAGNLSAARKLLLQICHAYRRDGWDMPLIQVLSQMREVATHMRLTSEHIVNSLELCCVPGAAPSVFLDSTAVQTAAQHAVALLLSGVSEIARPFGAGRSSTDSASSSSAEGASGGSRTGRSPSRSALHYHVEFINLKDEQRRAREAGDAHSTVAEILLRHRQQDFGWLRCIALSVGMQHPDPDSRHVDCYVALRNNLPVPLPLKSVTFTLSDETGQWAVVARAGGKLPKEQPTYRCDMAGSTAAAASSSEHHDTGTGPLPQSASLASSLSALELSATKGRCAAQGGPHTGVSEGAGPLTLDPGEWRTAAVRVAPRCVGRLQVEGISLAIGKHTIIHFKVSSFPPGTPLLGVSQFSEQQLPLLSRMGATPGLHQVMIPHLGCLPTLKVLAPRQALVGEHVAVCACISVSGLLSGAMLDVAVKSRGIKPEDITLTVGIDSDASLITLSSELGGAVPLNPIPAGSQRVVRAWVSSRQPGTVSVGIMLRCPSPLPQSLDVVFSHPFQHVCRINSEAGVHTLHPQSPTMADDTALSPLTIGQPIMLQMAITMLQTGPLELCYAKLYPNQEAGLMPVADLQPQLAGWPMHVGGGDELTLLLPICPTKLVEQAAASLGRLQLHWRRHRAQGEGVSEPEPMVTTDLELPSVFVGDSLLTARTVSPAQVTAGIAFTYSLQVQNFSGAPMEVAVTLLDSKGFVLSGERAQSNALGPRDSCTFMWLLVAHAAGHLPLPGIRVVAPKQNCSLVTQTKSIFVLPF